MTKVKKELEKHSEKDEKTTTFVSNIEFFFKGENSNTLVKTLSKTKVK